jgi:hypothetical protein
MSIDAAYELGLESTRKERLTMDVSEVNDIPSLQQWVAEHAFRVGHLGGPTKHPPGIDGRGRSSGSGRTSRTV